MTARTTLFLIAASACLIACGSTEEPDTLELGRSVSQTVSAAPAAQDTDTVVEGRIIVSTRPRVSYLPTRASQGSPPDEPINHNFRVNGSLLAVAAGVWFFFGFLVSHPRR